jgi:putative aldouronate transport system permease protein
MLVRSLGLINSVWAMIIPGAVSAFNLILMRNFIQQLPDSILESARLDGASEFRILVQIVVPLSLPALATIGLFYAVAHWNEFFRGIFYIVDSSKWPLQVLLRSIVIEADLNELGMTNQDLYGRLQVNQLTIRAATVMATVIPIALVYPFLQRYFVKGVVLGAEKG